jgi:23S rRNA (cytidine1920-2'-O)/16S rRNA (cytidine1409-2'-O)-methyltransferase
MKGKRLQRIDLLLVEQQLAESRQRAQALILAGKVYVNGRLVDKAGAKVPAEAVLSVRGGQMPYVSRGGLKLEAALEHFHIDVSGLTCLDVGASTGGFTDCLLQHGASKVQCVDVGYGQFAWKLRQDPRVKLFERTNIRYLKADALPCPVDLATIDVSFISLRIVVPAVLKFLRPDGDIMALIKPQFEAGKGAVGKGGVVRDPRQHEAIIKNLILFFRDMDLDSRGLVPSPVLGPKGNREFLILLRNGDKTTSTTMHHSFRPPLPDLKSQKHQNSLLFHQPPFPWDIRQSCSSALRSYSFFLP